MRCVLTALAFLALLPAYLWAHAATPKLYAPRDQAHAAGNTGPKLLFWGENWKENAPARSGEFWFAVRNDGKQSSLERVTVLVAPQTENGPRDVIVTLKEGFRPAFLVQGVSGLSPGPIRTVLDGQMPLVPNAIIHFRTRHSHWENVYLLARPRKPAFESGTRKYQNIFSVTLHSYGDSLSREPLTQTLVEYMEHPGSTPSLLWAGDLDRDGRIDLLLDVETAEAAGASYRLYLSSRARKGELVGMVASLRVLAT